MSAPARGAVIARRFRVLLIAAAILALIFAYAVRSPATVVGIVIFWLALVVSVLLHEFGHFATAKAFGVKATQFMVGFGSTLWSTRRGETEYGLKAIPLGGYVRITGMTNMEDVDPADEPRSLRAKSGWQRVAVLSAGSFMHFLIAFVLLWVLAIGIGTQNVNSTTVTVAACIPAKDGAVCTAHDPKSPAARAGLRTGDQIIAVAGHQVHSYTGLVSAIRKAPAGVPTALILLRDGKQLTLNVDLARPSWEAKKKYSYLGVTATEMFNRAGPLTAISNAGSQFGTIVTQSVAAFGQIPKAIPYLFAKNRAHTPAGQLSSVVGDANITGQVVAAGISWREKASLVLTIIISLNIFVGLFNLLPLLPLDGGHIAIVLFERGRAQLARLRRKPDPGPVDIQKVIPLSVGVFGLLVCLSLLLLAADILNPVTLS